MDLGRLILRRSAKRQLGCSLASAQSPSCSIACVWRTAVMLNGGLARYSSARRGWKWSFAFLCSWEMGTPDHARRSLAGIWMAGSQVTGSDKQPALPRHVSTASDGLQLIERMPTNNIAPEIYLPDDYLNFQGHCGALEARSFTEGLAPGHLYFTSLT